ncbi:hypothetical protein AAY473_017242, partial [Plecturocebus cupreus]
MVQSWLTATSASPVQVIILPWPPNVAGVYSANLILSAPRKHFNCLPLLLGSRPESLIVSRCHPGWSAVAQFQLSATSASWVQAILLPQPP